MGSTIGAVKGVVRGDLRQAKSEKALQWARIVVSAPLPFGAWPSGHSLSWSLRAPPPFFSFFFSAFGSFGLRGGPVTPPLSLAVWSRVWPFVARSSLGPPPFCQCAWVFLRSSFNHFSWQYVTHFWFILPSPILKLLMGSQVALSMGKPSHFVKNRQPW